MKIGKYHFITRAEFLKIIRMNYEYEFSRLLEAVNQFLRNKESKACLTVLENASQFYESQKPTHNKQSNKFTTRDCGAIRKKQKKIVKK